MSRKKKLVLASVVSVIVLAIVSGVAAAILIYTGTNGGANLKIEDGPVNKELSISATGAPPPLVKGVQTKVPITITNNAPAAAHTTVNTNVTFTSNPSECASHLTYQGGISNGLSVPAGGTNSA